MAVPTFLLLPTCRPHVNPTLAALSLLTGTSTGLKVFFYSADCHMCLSLARLRLILSLLCCDEECWRGCRHLAYACVSVFSDLKNLWLRMHSSSSLTAPVMRNVQQTGCLLSSREVDEYAVEFATLLALERIMSGTNRLSVQPIFFGHATRGWMNWLIVLCWLRFTIISWDVSLSFILLPIHWLPLPWCDPYPAVSGPVAHPQEA